MSLFWKLLESLKALSFVSKFGGFLSLIPGVGPVMSVITTLWDLLCTLLSTIFKSFVSLIKNPLSWVAVGLVWVFGAYCGIQWDWHLVERKDSQLQAYLKAANGALYLEKAKADAARAAAAAAEQLRKEQLERAKDNSPPPGCNPSDSAVKSGGVRSYRKPRASVYTVPGLPGF